MRPTAQVHERPVRIDRDRLVVTQLGDPLQLERVVCKAAISLGPVHHLADERIVGGRDRLHLGLDLLEILRRERPGDLEVVVEAVVDRRPEPDRRRREDLPDRRGQHVRRGMAEHVEGVGIAIRENRDRGVLIDRPAEIANLAVDPDCQGRAGEAGTDRLGEIEPGRTGGQLTDAAVRKGQSNGTHAGNDRRLGIRIRADRMTDDRGPRCQPEVQAETDQDRNRQEAEPDYWTFCHDLTAS